MIVPLLLALSAPAQAPETKVAYAYSVGTRTTYDLKGSLPVNEGDTRGEIKGQLVVRVISIAEDGSAEVEFLEKNGTIKTMGQSTELPETVPLVVKMDRQGYLLAEPTGGSFSGIAVLMFGIPGEPMPVGREFVWKPGGSFPAKDGEGATVKLREVKRGKATFERSVTSKDGQKIEIVSTHELATGRLTQGEISSKNGGYGEVKITLTLRSVTKN